MSTPKAILCVILSASVCIMLGIWQLQRLRWKEGILSLVAQSNLSAFEPIENIIPNYKNTAAYDLKSVRLKGYFRHDLETKIAPRTLKGKAGAHLLTPFVLSSGKTVIINRGWIPQVSNQPMEITRPQGEIERLGFIRQPTPASMFTPQNDVNKGLWFHINLNELTQFLAKTDKLLAKEILPFYIMQRPDEGLAGYPIAIDLRATLPNNHLQYAVTWFFLAFGLILGYLGYRRKA